MDEINQNEKKGIGGSCYLNKNCWLVKNLNYAPYKRCQYCEFKFRNCLFLQYQAISLFLILLFFSLFLLIEKKLSLLAIITVFTLIIVYGYFFNKSTEKIIKSNFSLKKTRDALKELTDNLEEKVEAQTRDLKAKNLHLQKLLKMRSEFLDVASHQLRTPVSVIKNTMEMMDNGDFDKITLAEKRKYIRNAYEKTVKLQQIISDILMTSELDTADFVVHNKTAQTIQLEELVDKAVSDTRFEAEERKITLEWSKPKKAMPPIIGYEQYLSQAVFNLIDNAVKYTPSVDETAEARDTRAEHGKVTISMEENGNKVILTIKDNGIGIPKKEIGQLFKKFSRASNARNMYTDGTGLGLFIAKEIVEGHHGRVDAQSEIGKGATFKIYLPIKQTAI